MIKLVQNFQSKSVKWKWKKYFLYQKIGHDPVFVLREIDTTMVVVENDFQV